MTTAPTDDIRSLRDELERTQMVVRELRRELAAAKTLQSVKVINRSDRNPVMSSRACRRLLRRLFVRLRE